MNRCGIVKHRSQVCRATLSVRFPGGGESGSLIWAPPLQPPAASSHTLALNRALASSDIPGADCRLESRDPDQPPPADQIPRGVRDNSISGYINFVNQYHIFTPV